MSQEVVRQIVRRMGGGGERGCICETALKYSLITERAMIPETTRRALAPIIGKYIPES